MIYHIIRHVTPQPTVGYLTNIIVEYILDLKDIGYK